MYYILMSDIDQRTNFGIVQTKILTEIILEIIGINLRVFVPMSLAIPTSINTLIVVTCRLFVGQLRLEHLGC